MEFYELRLYDWDLYRHAPTVGYRSEDFAKVQSRLNAFLAAKEKNKGSGKLYYPLRTTDPSIIHSQFISNEDGSISRYEMIICGKRSAGPMFEHLPGEGYFDYREHKLTEDEKTVLEIQLKQKNPTLVDTPV